MTPSSWQKQGTICRVTGPGRFIEIEVAATTTSKPSQFTREYARQFGLPPTRDTARLRESSVVFHEMNP